MTTPLQQAQADAAAVSAYLATLSPAPPPSSVTISFNAEGGSAVASITVPVGTSIEEPPTTRTGYTFQGWFTAATGGTPIVFPYVAPASLTLYAQWVAVVVATTTSPSGFARPAVPAGMTETKWEGFAGDSLSALGYTAGAGKNAEGAFWAPWHVTVENSIATIAGYPDTSLVGQWSVTQAELAAVNNYVAGQFGITSPLIATAAKVRILVSMRADADPGFTSLALVTGTTGEGDFDEQNSPLTLNAGTIHWANWTEQEYAQNADNLTAWTVMGIQWGVTPGQIDFLKQTTPTGPLTIWKSFPLPSSTWAKGMYLALQLQTNDAIYNSGTPTFPANNPNVTASNPIKQQHDWVQICTGTA